MDRFIGRGEGNLFFWLVENRGFDALEKDKYIGKLYDDNLCYFRCLVRYLGYSLKNFERKIGEFVI